MMRCPTCRAEETKVVDSRLADDGAAVRRRRRCEVCGARCTTFERVDLAPLAVVKADGSIEPFDRDKLLAGMRSAAKGRPVDEACLHEVANNVEDAMRLSGDQVTSSEVGICVLERLRDLDEVAYLRFASVYKNFDAAADFVDELENLKTLGDKIS